VGRRPRRQAPDGGFDPQNQRHRDQQELTELMMEAVGPYALPHLPIAWGDHWIGGMSAGLCAPLAARYFNYARPASTAAPTRSNAHHRSDGFGFMNNPQPQRHRDRRNSGQPVTSRNDGEPRKLDSQDFLCPLCLVVRMYELRLTEDSKMLKDSVQRSWRRIAA